MSLKNTGVTVLCDSCEYLSDNGHGGFDVTVPINDVETGISGAARLHCTISDKHHRVELTEWSPADHCSGRSTESFLSRVTEVLSLIADQRICGNRNICPSEVTRIIEEGICSKADNATFP